MRELSASELMTVWEHGLNQPALARALSLLAAAGIEDAAGSSVQLSIGQRDARLWELRAALFGPDLEAFVTCPRCAERLELNFSANLFCPGDTTTTDSEVTLRIDDCEVRLRAPNSQDLLALPAGTDLAAARDHILRRCMLSVRTGSAVLDFDAIPRDVVEAAAQKITEIDPLADIRISICCQACRHVWQAALDAVSFLWEEIDAWARRVLVEVHTLASAYGWTEREILSLSARRRQFYLDMVGA